MSATTAPAQIKPQVEPQVEQTAPAAAFHILAAISLAHFLNDLMQSLMPAIYPVLKANYHLSFLQIGILTFSWYAAASVLQPIVGLITDKRPLPFLLVVGMGLSLLGLLAVSRANLYWLLLVANLLIGVGSSIFHPESSRIARLASGGRHGMAQSLFQVGGNVGTSMGPLLAAYIVVPNGQHSLGWFTGIAVAGMVLQYQVGKWYRAHLAKPRPPRRAAHAALLSPTQVQIAIAVLLLLIFSKFFYLASLTSYYTFYLIRHFGLGVRSADLHLFIFMAAVAIGTILGGPIGDRIGRKPVIWVSILGVLPFTLALPHANLLWTTLLTIPIGLLIASAFPAIVVYAQELLPGKTGTVAGLFFGFAFGIAGIGAAVLGWVADLTSIETVYRLCALLPVIGVLAALLPKTRQA